MSELTAQINAAIASHIDPFLNMDLVSAKCVKKIQAETSDVVVNIELGYPAEGVMQSTAEALKAAIEAVDGVTSATVDVTWKVTAHKVQKGIQRLENIKNIVAVASGKGGVGKSTTSVNLALSLAADGARVGLLDADIYGPSQPRMMGLSGRPESSDGETMQPLENYGVQTMSIGFMIDDETPMIWRGPMVTSALEQLLRQTNWDNLDYLIIDLPPGTGDTQLTLSQKVPLSGAVIVTTPQDIALLDARKGLKMFEKVEVPILGIVENMSTHVCTNCGHEEHIFGAGGGEAMSADYDVNFLGALPLDIRIREQADNGMPTVVAEPDGTLAMAYRDIGRRMAGQLAIKSKDYSGAFPKIVIENS